MRRCKEICTNLLAFLCAEFILRDAYGRPLPADWKRRIDSAIYRQFHKRANCTKLDARTNRNLFQGDIILEEGFMDGSRTFTGELFPQQFWPNDGKNVPYQISEAFDLTEVTMIKQAFAELTAKTSGCITFKERFTEEDYVHIVSPASRTACSSLIGRGGGRQTLNLGKECLINGIIQHEIMHALGIFHEQSRPDRDYFVFINEENVYPGTLSNFQILPKMATYGVTYDMSSVMHYAWNDLAIDAEKPTIIPRDPNAKAKMGQRVSLTSSDVAKLKAAYHCSDTTSSPTALKPTETTVPAPTAMDLPYFRMDAITPAECRQLDSLNCDVSAGSDNCDSSILYVACSIKAGNDEITSLFRKIQALDRDRPIFVEIQGLRRLTWEIFHPVHSNIIELTVGYYSGLSSTTIRTLNLPNLLGLGFWQCDQVSIHTNHLSVFPKLKVIEFGQSTVEEIEEGAFDGLNSLALIALDYDMKSPFTKSQMDHLRKLHCSCRYKWLRRMFREQPGLISGKKWAEIYKFGNRGSMVYDVSAIFVPVDCARTVSGFLAGPNKPFAATDRC